MLISVSLHSVTAGRRIFGLHGYFLTPSCHEGKVLSRTQTLLQVAGLHEARGRMQIKEGGALPVMRATLLLSFMRCSTLLQAAPVATSSCSPL